MIGLPDAAIVSDRTWRLDGAPGGGPQPGRVWAVALIPEGGRLALDGREVGAVLVPPGEAPIRADAARFFEAALGLTFTPWESADDGVFDAGGFRFGLHEGASPSLTAYFPVADIEAAVCAVREAGGKAAQPSPPEPGFGRFARCTAPGGVAFGLHQPG